MIMKNRNKLITEEERLAKRNAYNKAYLVEYRKRPGVKEVTKIYQKQYRQRDYVKESHGIANKRWAQTEAGKTSKKKYRDSERGRENRQDWVSKGGSKELIKQYNHKYNQSELGKATNKKSLHRYREKLRRDLMRLIGLKCVRCDYSDVRALEIDHVNNNGSLERKRFGHYRAEWNHYIKNPNEIVKNLPILCCNCNKIKYFETLEL
jgi:hypothetical protein